MSHVNVSNLKIENFTNLIMLFPFLTSISYY